MSGPRIEGRQDGCQVLTGEWTLWALTPHLPPLRAQLAAVPPEAAWDLTAVAHLDSFGAMLLWRAWGRQWPADLRISDELQAVIQAVADQSELPFPEPPPFRPIDAMVLFGSGLIGFGRHLLDFIALFGRFLLNIVVLLHRPGQWPLKEISATFYKAGVKALPVAALVGFLIGVVLSYLSAMQLRTFGAEIYIVNILGLGIVRELGPVLVALLVAGRSGSAMTAQLGVMRVTEEMDALAAMGISRSIRLVLPKVLALMLVMPLLVLWTSGVALFGGMVSAFFQLDISFTFFIESLPRVVPVANLYIGLAKGVVFGLLIALVACHFGLRIKPNTESLAANTTASVVTAITLVILVDAVFAVATRNIGMPL